MSSLLTWLLEHESNFRKSRLPSLYSDLNVQRTSNPDGYSANLTAWQASLKAAALAGQLPNDNRLILQSSDGLLNALASPEYGRPTGLGAVIDDSVRSGTMIDLKDFLTTERSIYSRNWVPSPWAILRWSLRQIGLIPTESYDVSGGRLKTGNLVLVHALEDLSKQIVAQSIKRGDNLTDRVMTRDDFVNDMVLPSLISKEPTSWSEQDLEVLLRYLSRDKPILSYNSAAVKFKSSTASTPEPITPEDTSIANLKRLLSTMQAQTTALQLKITSLHQTAQAAIKSNPPQKQTALSALRSKKLAESTLASRLSNVHQLEQVYTQIESASTQVELVSAMRSSASVLRVLNAQTGGVESVDKVMDELREQMDLSSDVGVVLREPLDATAAAEAEMDVDEEFEALEAEETTKREEAAEREKKVKDERDAAETQKRLAALEPRSAAGEVTDKPVQAEQAEGKQVDSAMKRLSQMSIDDKEEGQPAQNLEQERVV